MQFPCHRLIYGRHQRGSVHYAWRPLSFHHHYRDHRNQMRVGEAGPSGPARLLSQKEKFINNLLSNHSSEKWNLQSRQVSFSTWMDAAERFTDKTKSLPPRLNRSGSEFYFFFVRQKTTEKKVGKRKRPRKRNRRGKLEQNAHSSSKFNWQIKGKQ